MGSNKKKNVILDQKWNMPAKNESKKYKSKVNVQVDTGRQKLIA